eukprot:scaffold24723_cov62-Phaeocystis_antarctica.AAC.3
MGCSATAEQVVGLRLRLCRHLLGVSFLAGASPGDQRPVHRGLTCHRPCPSLGSRRESHSKPTDPSLPALAGNGQP